MNNKAKAIGMKNTHFVNPTGAENSRLRTFAPTKYKDQERTVTTARDYAILDLHVIKETPKNIRLYKAVSTNNACSYVLHIQLFIGRCKNEFDWYRWFKNWIK